MRQRRASGLDLTSRPLLYPVAKGFPERNGNYILRLRSSNVSDEALPDPSVRQRDHLSVIPLIELCAVLPVCLFPLYSTEGCGKGIGSLRSLSALLHRNTGRYGYASSLTCKLLRISREKIASLGNVLTVLHIKGGNKVYRGL